VPLTEDWRQSLATTIMPAFVLGNAIAAILMRHTRSAMLQAMNSDYVRTARARDCSSARSILKHAMRNALTPVITLGALEFGTLLSGAVLTEQIFTIPGFGKLIIDAVFNRDYAVVQGVVLVTATTYITLNLSPTCSTCWSIRGCAHDRTSPLDSALVARADERVESPMRRALRGSSAARARWSASW
jgi:peptide/nickel transport system permease protein